jgi:hypothetical protein
MRARYRIAFATLIVSSALFLAPARPVQALAGNINGYVDLTTIDHIGGWAIDYDNPGCAINVHIYIYDYGADGSLSNLRTFGVTANQFRADVGSHAFTFNPRGQGLTPGVKYMQAYAIGINSGCAVDHVNPPLNQTVATTYFEVPASLSSNGVTCDAFSRNPTAPTAAEKALMPVVMTNTTGKLAYDFNVVRLDDAASDHVAIFHSDPIGGGSGDATAVRYASSPDGSFGARDATHLVSHQGQSYDDRVITTTASPSTFMWNDPAGSGDVSGGANPHLIWRNANPAWTVFYISVAQYPSTAGWRHWLHIAHPYNIGNMYVAAPNNWVTLASSGWAFFDGPPYLKHYEPWPVNNWPSGGELGSLFAGPDAFTTQGLIGNITYNADKSRIYFYYIDQVNGNALGYGPDLRTMRREMPDLVSVNWWKAAETVFTARWDEVTYNAGVGRWAIFRDGHLLFSANGSDDFTTWNLPATSAANQLPAINGGFCLSNTQPGFLKNKWGQLPGDFRIYYPTDCTNGPYGNKVRAMRLKCQ